MTVYSAGYWWYSDCVFWLCTGGTVTVDSSCVLGYSDCILAVYWGYNDCILAVYWWYNDCILAVYWGYSDCVF